MKTIQKTIFLTFLAFIAVGSPAFAEKLTLTMEIKNHIFVPDTLNVPANTPWVLIIKNNDATPEEFESHELKREKIIPANGQIRINFGALKEGTYHFFGEFNPKTAKGTVVVK